MRASADERVASNDFSTWNSLAAGGDSGGATAPKGRS